MSKEKLESLTGIATTEETQGFKEFLKEVQDFARTVGEPCQEGHRLDPTSGRCLPLSGHNPTEETQSVNNDDGPFWRGEETKPNVTFASDQDSEKALDADDMDEPESCAEGTTFSFVQRKCVTLEEAELENDDELAADESAQMSVEPRMKQPEGRRDTPNHDCPPNQFFDYKNRHCIPLNKDTVLASELVDEKFKKAVARFGKVAKTSPDPMDGHIHFVTVNEDGDGMTSVEIGGLKENYPHSHEVVEFEVTPHEQEGTDYVSMHPGAVNPMDTDDDDHAESMPMPFGSLGEEQGDIEKSAPLKSKQRTALPDSAFGVPSKRKFPLDSCARVRNAMARFNQAKGLSAGEKATLRRKILSRAKTCGIEVQRFAKATTDEEFAAISKELLLEVFAQELNERYRAEKSQDRGPCPPGMVWDAKSKSCKKMRGFVDSVKASHTDVIALDPEGRKDTVGFECPPGWFFDFKNRECLPLDPSQKKGTTTTKAAEEGQSRKLSPQPSGRPARLPQDCPAGTIWDADLEKCKPLDSRKKTKSDDESAQEGKNGKKGQSPANGPGKSDCGPDEFFNPVSKKCMPRTNPFGKKSKSEKEEAVNAQPGNREGLVPHPTGKVKHPTDCPPGTLWDGKLKVCKELDTMKKVSPGNERLDPRMHSSIEGLSIASIIQNLDKILVEDTQRGRKEKSKVAAKNLPSSAFPPSLVSPTKRSLMHHTPDVQDPYDHASVDVGRLRNALARSTKVEGFSDKAIEDGIEHLLYHAREIIRSRLEKKV